MYALDILRNPCDCREEVVKFLAIFLIVLDMYGALFLMKTLQRWLFYRKPHLACNGEFWVVRKKEAFRSWNYLEFEQPMQWYDNTDARRTKLYGTEKEAREAFDSYTKKTAPYKKVK